MIRIFQWCQEYIQIALSNSNSWQTFCNRLLVRSWLTADRRISWELDSNLCHSLRNQLCKVGEQGREELTCFSSLHSKLSRGNSNSFDICIVKVGEHSSVLSLPPSWVGTDAMILITVFLKGEEKRLISLFCSPSQHIRVWRTKGKFSGHPLPPSMRCISSLGGSKVSRMEDQRTQLLDDQLRVHTWLVHPPPKKKSLLVTENFSLAGSKKLSPKWSFISWKSSPDGFTDPFPMETQEQGAKSSFINCLPDCPLASRIWAEMAGASLILHSHNNQ